MCGKIDISGLKRYIISEDAHDEIINRLYSKIGLSKMKKTILACLHFESLLALPQALHKMAQDIST